MCNYDECDKPVFCRGRCRKHYRLYPEIRAKELFYREEYKSKRKPIYTKYNNSLKGKQAISKYQYTWKGRYAAAKSIAKRKNKFFDLTLEQFSHLLSKGCYYCGKELHSECGIGLDRIDNKIAYVLDNVVSCCGHCNILRGHLLSKEETIEVIKLLKLLRNKESLWENHDKVFQRTDRQELKQIFPVSLAALIPTLKET